MLSRAEIAARGAAASTTNERRRGQVIGLLADQVPLAEIIVATGYRARTIRELGRRYRASGAAALTDRRRTSKGAAPLLNAALQSELQRALLQPPDCGGHWTGPKVAQWIADRTGKPIHRQRGWEYLRRLRPVDPGMPLYSDGGEEGDQHTNGMVRSARGLPDP